MKVPDPFLGPKGVRLLLAARGFVGYVEDLPCPYLVEFSALQSIRPFDLKPSLSTADFSVSLAFTHRYGTYRCLTPQCSHSWPQCALL